MLWQSFLLTRKGNVLLSSGNLLPAHLLLHLSLPENMPFFQSLWPSITALPMDAFPLMYPAVKSPHHLLRGIYDISLVPDKKFFRCKLIDKTRLYQAKQREMQSLSQDALEAERHSDVFTKKNFLS